GTAWKSLHSQSPATEPTYACNSSILLVFIAQARGLLALFQFHAGCDRLPVADDLYIHHVADFAAAQSIREIVKVLDGVIAELDEHVPCFQPGFGRRRTRFDVRKFHAVFALPKVRDRAEICSIAPSTAARARRRLVFRYSDEGWPLGRRSELLRD